MHTHFNVKTILDHSSEEYCTEELLNLNLYKKKKLIEESCSVIGSDAVKFVPLKASSLINPNVLEELSRRRGNSLHPEDGISGESTARLLQLPAPLDAQLQSGMQRLTEICSTAREHGISLLLDAEESDRQPGLEAVYRVLAKQFNRSSDSRKASADGSADSHSPTTQSCGPVIYNTYQSYLRRTEVALTRDMAHANENQYIFAFKLVRGAYMKSELRRVASTALQGRNFQSPLHESKMDVDATYNRIVHRTILQIHQGSNLRIMVATHNKESILQALNKMEQLNLPNDHPYIHFAQILGMTDNLTFALGLGNYNVAKLLLFGEFGDILPWLLRRMDENHVCVIVYHA